MKKVILFLLCLICFNQNLLKAQFIDVLTKEITDNQTSDSAKVVAIYDWLTHNVSYDDAHKKPREGDTILRQEPYNVIVLKRATCMGYAKTFREMCRISGIEAFVIEGWAKNPNGMIEREGHAWNVVNINNSWYPLDATWGAGNMSEAQKYFLRDPSVFVENHLPRDPMWQLLNAPISMDCFTKNKNCNPDDFQINFADTIRVWRQMDSLQQIHNQSIRILKFFPKDLMAVRNLADFYVLKAKQNYDEYEKIRKDIKAKKRLPNNKNAVLSLINSAIENLNSAEIKYQQLVDNSSVNALTDAHLNLNSVQETLKKLETEKSFIENNFKD
jgi:transglutaminase/protease-like cytokinesis protein 3